MVWIRRRRVRIVAPCRRAAEGVGPYDGNRVGWRFLSFDAQGVHDGLLAAGRLFGRARCFVAPSSGPSGHLPPVGEGYFLSFDAQGGHDGLFPGAHLLFLGAFVQVVVAQQMEDGVNHQIAQLPLLRVAVLRRLGPDPL